MDINWTAVTLWTVAYLVVGYLTCLVEAYIIGQEDTTGFWGSMVVFWPLVWIMGLIFLVIWLLDVPFNWMARQGAKRWDR